MKFTKLDMKYEHDYEWDKFDSHSSRISGEPDETEFNRNQGSQVLYLLNWFDFEVMTEFLKAEHMIKKFMPANVKTQEEVKKWILHNWGNPEYKL